MTILHVLVHLLPGNALFSVHLLTVPHQFIWPSPLIYNKMLNKTHFSLRSMQALPGFNVHVRGQIDGADGEAIENIARYMSIKIQETKGTGKASSTWTRLIHRIFEVNPLQCTKCGGNMRVVAFITDYQISKNILKHIGEETDLPPLLRTH